MGGDRIDFFISHAGADRPWAEWVAWQLIGAGYTVELDVWDWAAGRNFVTSMSDANIKAQILSDNQGIKSIQQAIAGGNISDTDKLVLLQLLRSDQLDRTTNSQLLLLATKVESPSVYLRAAANKITARSRRNTVVVSALIGLILGAIAALLWDPVASRVTPRNGE